MSRLEVSDDAVSMVNLPNFVPFNSEKNLPNSSVIHIFGCFAETMGLYNLKGVDHWISA